MFLGGLYFFSKWSSSPNGNVKGDCSIFQVHWNGIDGTWPLSYQPLEIAGATMKASRRDRRGGSGRLSAQHRPFPCTMCSKSFLHKAHLSRHMQVHTGKYSFYCELCRKGFNEKSNFEAHMKKHTGCSFPCQYCTKRYSDEKNLRAHMKKSHVDKLE